MGWVEDHNNAGPWTPASNEVFPTAGTPYTLVEQEDKWGYINNSRWSSQGDAQEFCEDIGLSLDPDHKHQPCGHWHKEESYETVFPSGRWVAAMEQPGTPYIYVYDIAYKAVIKIDTSSILPIVVDRLKLNSTYDLDHSRGRGEGGTQRGAYCMNKDGTRIWYLFRTSNNCELTEVDISNPDLANMIKVKSTLFNSLMSDEAINDACSNNTHTFWATSLNTLRIIKIENASHTITDDHYFNISDPVYPICGIDVNTNNEKIYWMYEDVYSPDPRFSEIQIVKADYSLSIELIKSWVHTWANFLKCCSGYVMTHRCYHPSYGRLAKRDLSTLDYTYYSNQEYMLNLFDEVGGNLYILMHHNNIYANHHLRCTNFADMSFISSVNVDYYCKDLGDGWDETNVSAMNKQTRTIVLFRYHKTEKVNYLACFEASDDLTLLCDVPRNYITVTKTPNVSTEPQVWDLP